MCQVFMVMTLYIIKYEKSQKEKTSVEACQSHEFICVINESRKGKCHDDHRQFHMTVADDRCSHK